MAERKIACQLTFGKTSPVYPLYSSILKKERNCHKVDIGYDYIDYSVKPGKLQRAGIGDNVIDERDVLQFAQENWQKYQKPFGSYLGYSPFSYLYKSEFKKTSGNFINFIKKTIKEDSVNYKEKVAAVLYWFVMFPRLDQWNKLSTEEQDNFENNMTELKKMGLTDVIEYFKKDGGLGIKFDLTLIRNSPNEFNFMMAGDQQTAFVVLYSHMLKKMGVDTAFFRVIYYKYYPYRCGEIFNITCSIGAMTDNGWRLFAPLYNGTHMEIFPHSMTTLNEELLGNRIMINLLFGREWEDGNHIKYSENPTITYAKLLQELRKGADMEAVLKKIKDVKSVTANFAFVVISMLEHGFVDVEYINSTISDESLLLSLRMVAASSQQKGYVKLLKVAEEKLKSDPGCISATDAVAKAYDGLGEHKKAIEAMKRIEDLLPEAEWQVSYFYVRLGNNYLKNNEYNKAEAAYNQALHLLKTDTEDKFEAALKVFIIKYRQNKREEASNELSRMLYVLSRAPQLTVKKWEGLVEDFEKDIAEHAVNFLTLKSNKNASQKIAQIFTGIGDNFFLRNDLEHAKVWYEKSVDFNSNKREIFRKLSFIYFKQNNIKKGVEYLRAYNKLK